MLHNTGAFLRDRQDDEDWSELSSPPWISGEGVGHRGLRHIFMLVLFGGGSPMWFWYVETMFDVTNV